MNATPSRYLDYSKSADQAQVGSMNIATEISDSTEPGGRLYASNGQPRVKVD